MITPKTLVQFLCGNRKAIEQIASAKHALILGFPFIISAGLARNYDEEFVTQRYRKFRQHLRNRIS